MSGFSKLVGNCYSIDKYLSLVLYFSELMTYVPFHGPREIRERYRNRYRYWVVVVDDIKMWKYMKYKHNVKDDSLPILCCKQEADSLGA